MCCVALMLLLEHPPHFMAGSSNVCIFLLYLELFSFFIIIIYLIHRVDNTTTVLLFHRDILHLDMTLPTAIV